ncbi:diguanylate cyclase [Maridesulfovibrio sp. FT414]|uniref:diguanylate cyclase n=1 Tax=Maridesulfovibrio sp. FT414 TaxID=2979469 RepID=UPI003D8032AA
MQQRDKSRFHSVALFVLVVLIAGGLITMTAGMIYSMSAERVKLMHELDEFQAQTVQTLAGSTKDAMLSFSPEEVRNIVSVLLQDDRVVSINIFSEIYDIHLLQASKQTSLKQFDTMLMSELVVNKDEVLGYVQVEVDKGWVLSRIRKERNNIILLFAAMFVGGLLLVIPVIYWRILWPLNRLIDQADGLSQGDFDTGFEWKGRDELSMLGRTLDDMRSKVKSSINSMKEMAVTDELTGLPNRRGFNAEIGRLLQLSVRYGHPLALAVLDLDYFKQINDRFGHGVGDEVLRGFARKVGLRIRKTDLFARVGGEEFVLVMPETSIEAAGLLLNDLRRVISSQPFDHGENLSVSAGVTCFNGLESVDALLERADQALYEAKRTGRDRVVVHRCPDPA